MAKMIEIKFRAQAKELEKLNGKLERAEKALAKAQAKAEKLGVAEWTWEEWRAWLDNEVEKDGCYIVNKQDIEKNSAWRDRFSAQRELEDIKKSIEKAESRVEAALEKVEEYHREIEKIEDLKRKEELRKLEFEQEQREWAKDGITLEHRYWGKTPSGKPFMIYGNSGVTERSWHCFTLRIGYETIFTSGEFWRAYNVIKNS